MLTSYTISFSMITSIHSASFKSAVNAALTRKAKKKWQREIWKFPLLCEEMLQYLNNGTLNAQMVQSALPEMPEESQPLCHFPPQLLPMPSHKSSHTYSHAISYGLRHFGAWSASRQFANIHPALHDNPLLSHSPLPTPPPTAALATSPTTPSLIYHQNPLPMGISSL